jgi:hypothetical protein
MRSKRKKTPAENEGLRRCGPGVRGDDAPLQGARARLLGTLFLRAGNLRFLGNDAAQTLSDVEALVARAHALGIAHRGPFAGGPHTTELSRDIARALFVAWRALQTLSAFTEYGGDGWPNFREDMERATNVLRDGRPDKSSGHSLRMAISMAEQGVGMALGVGFVGSTREQALRLLRDTFSQLFGEVFRQHPADDEVMKHFASTAPASKALRSATGEDQTWRHAFHLAAIALAADIIWAGREHAIVERRAGDEVFFRFPMEDGDKSRRKLLGRLQTFDGRRRSPSK